MSLKNVLVGNNEQVKWLVRYFLFFLLFYPFSTAYADTNIQIVVNGATGDIAQNINLRISAKQNEYPMVLSSLQARQLYLAIQEEIKRAIQPYGYFKANVQSYLIRRHFVWLAVYNINLGPQLMIRSVRVMISGSGQNNAALASYARSFPIKSHQPFVVPTYNNAKTNFFKLAKNEGYLRARFSNHIGIDLKKYTADISIHLLTGPRYYFGPVTFETQPYSHGFMRRFILFNTGDVFSSKRLISLQQAMEKSYYFKHVVLQPDFTNTQNYHVPVRAYLYAPKAKRYNLGLGYGTLTGLRVSGAVSLRHLNDEGHHLETELDLSSVLGGASVSYYIPGKNPLTDEWMFGVNFKRFNPKNGKSFTGTLTGGYSTKTETLQTNINLNYLVERFYAFRPHIFHWTHLLYPSWRVSFLNADDIARPRNAVFLSLNLQAASESLLSATTFGQVTGRAKFLYSPFTASRFIFRADLGYIAVQDLKKFPLSLRYFAGGINSIRGYGEMNIGPGKYLDVFSLEYQHQIRNALYGAIFYDIGSAANVFNTKIRSSTGLGVVYDSPIGPIKGYIARQLSRVRKPYSFEISLGPEFA